MWINTLSGVLLFCLPLSEVPNYFSNYLQAREASEKRQKPMLIFVSSPDCKPCESAWTAYTKDAIAVNAYVSTRVDMENFDGKVIADMFDVVNAPAWIVLDTEGRIREQWSGGWKDAAGNPTVFAQPAGGSKTKIAETPKSPSPTSAAPLEVAVETKTTVPAASASKAETQVATTVVPPVTEMKSGYVLQAGYFGSEANAQQCIADMKAKGCGAYTIKITIKDGVTYYRVISAPYATETEANTRMTQAAKAGAKVTVKKVIEI